MVVLGISRGIGSSIGNGIGTDGKGRYAGVTRAGIGMGVGIGAGVCGGTRSEWVRYSVLGWYR